MGEAVPLSISNITKMPSVECDCPFCPLVKRNVQVCDIIVRFPTTTTVEFKGIPDDLWDLRGNFCTIALFARNNLRLKAKVGHCRTLDRSDYICNVVCLTKNVYKVCFHAKSDSK